MVIQAVLAARIPVRPASSKINGRLFDDLWLLCCQCWTFHPTLRPSMQQVFDSLLTLRSMPSDIGVETPSLGHLDDALGFVAAEGAMAALRAAKLRSAN
jgi:hypothetical protein